MGRKGRAHSKREPTESPGLTQLLPATSFESQSGQRMRDPETTLKSNTAQRGRREPERMVPKKKGEEVVSKRER